MDQSSALTSAIQSLRIPSHTCEDSQTKVKRVVYNLPQIRNPQNLWLLLNELALSPGLLSFSRYENLAVVMMAVDGITYSANRKSIVSDPTLSYHEWEQQLVQCAYRLPPLFGLIITAGLCAHQSTVDNMLLSFITTVADDIQCPDMVLLAGGCLARAQWSPVVYRSVFSQLRPHTRSTLLQSIQDMVFDTILLGFDSALVYGDFASWSRTLGKLLEFTDLASMHVFLDRLRLYVYEVVKNVSYSSLDLLKKLSFGITMQIEGLLSQVVSNVHLCSSSRTALVGKSLASLQLLGAVFESVGTQFPSYQFVHNACLDVLNNASPRERLEVVHELGDHWGTGRKVKTELDAGNLLFFLNICEQLILVLTTLEAQHTVVPIAQQHLTLSHSKSLKLGGAVFEAAHAVMLAFFAGHSNQPNNQVNEAALQYFDHLIILFPQSISGQQLISAVSAVLRATSPPNKEFVLNRLFDLAKKMIPGTEIPVNSEELIPPTLRSAVISALLQGVAQYASPHQLQLWLPRISSMVPQPTSTATQRERDYLLQIFRNVVTSMGELSDIGIRWYFSEGWARL